jgi:23S rRNA pseudouridine2605 synthase
MARERLQKLIARAGVASRRAAESLIVAGRVCVDGEVVSELGASADPDHQTIAVDGQPITAESPVYIVLHKPRGVVTTLSDPEGRTTVAQLVQDVGVRVVPVGRLDWDTSGTLLMTNDGDFAAALQHPRNQAPKIYRARVRGLLDELALRRWRQSIEIDGRYTRPATIRLLETGEGEPWLEILLHEGRNRQVRRLGDAAGTPVARLIRVSQAGITHEGLRPGEWRHLTGRELEQLTRQFGVPRPRSLPGPSPVRGGRGPSGVRHG